MTTAAFKHELFLIEETKSNKGIYQDRLVVPREVCFLLIQGQSYEVESLSCFECRIRATPDQYEFLRTQTVMNLDAQLYYMDTQAQKLSLKFLEVKETTESDRNVLLKFEILGEPLKVERIKALNLSAGIVADQLQYGSNLAQLPLAFKSYVYELRDCLLRLKSQIDELEKKTPVDNLGEANEYRSAIAEVISDYLLKVMPARYIEIPAAIEGITKEQMPWATEFARQHIGTLVYGAPFASRAYHKPRGYAGDYEMMNHLYRNELVGASLFDQCLHKYFIDEHAGAAVKNRAQYLFEKITQLFEATPKEQPLKILSVASGPAMEQQLFVKNGQSHYGRPVEFTCLDQDEESLKFAQRHLLSADRLAGGSGFNFNFSNMAIRNVIGRGLPEKDYDLVYSAGLFDYFTEQVCRAAAVKMLASVKEGGQVIIGNFSKTNPCAPFMELILDWHLIYRSEEDLLRIFQGLGSKIWIEKEPLGINLFVVIQK